MQTDPTKCKSATRCLKTITPDFLRSAKLEPLGTSGLGSAIFCCYQGYQSSTKTMSNTHPFNGPFAGNTQVSQYQKGKTNLDFSEARDSEWQWHLLGHMQVCTSVQADNHASTLPLSFLQAALPAAQPTASKHWWQETMSKATWNLINTRRREFDLPFHGSLITACGGTLYSRRRLWCLSDCYVHRLTQDAKTIIKT